MKNVLIALGLAFALYGCGKDGGSSNGGNGIANNYACPAGQYYTMYGCLNQGFCQVGQAQYQNTCVPVTGNIAQNQMSCQGSCPAGQVQTQWGCYPQNASCGACGALINNQCVQGYSYNYNYGGYNNYGGYYNYQYYYPYNMNYPYGGYNNCSFKSWGYFCY